MARPRKYEPTQLVAMFRLAAELRARMLDGGFTDNGGAIHSAERVLNILGLRVCYPVLTHIKKLSSLEDAHFSEAALTSHVAGEKTLIEHVNPHRALTRLAIQRIEDGANDEEFLNFVRDNFKLALLTAEETLRLNKLNRSAISANRLASAGIRLVQQTASPPSGQSS